MITIDPEFSSLIPPLSPDELTALDTSLLTEGCRDALVTWRGVLIDGHNRYALCLSHDIPFTTIERDFDSREDVMLWMISNQLARRNITTFARSELALKSKAVIAAKAKTQQGTRTDILLTSTESLKPINTRKELSDSSGASQDAIYKSEIILESAPQPIQQAARSGEMSINRAYKLTRALEQTPDEHQERILQLCGDNDEKVHILNRLYKSQGSPETNGTFDEIVTNGGFHAGKDMERWIDFAGTSIQEIQKALLTVAEHHKNIAKDVKRQMKQSQFDNAVVDEDSDYRVLVGDLSQLVDEIPDGSVDLFFSDPPYHADKPYLYGELAALAASKLKPGGLCLAYSGQMHLPETIRQMADHLVYWWMFAIRHTGGHLTIWNRQVWNDWKPVLVFAKPDDNGKLRAAADWTQDFIEGGGRDKNFHAWGQDANEATYWIEKLTQPGALICDPFVGGGAIGVACKLTKRRYIGTEINEQQANIAKVRLQGVIIDAAN